MDLSLPESFQRGEGPAPGAPLPDGGFLGFGTSAVAIAEAVRRGLTGRGG